MRRITYMAVVFVALMAQICPAVKFSVFVRDGETGEAIPDATVRSCYLKDNPSKILESKGLDFCQRGSNEHGWCVTRANDWNKIVEFRTAKTGYYSTIKRLDYRNLPEPLVATVQLYKIERPVPLFVHLESFSWNLKVDSNGEEILKYDLFASEWLPPYGTGTVADIVFRCKYTDLGPFTDAPQTHSHGHRTRFEIEFPGKDNGIVDVTSTPDMRLWVRLAPEVGYVGRTVSWEEVAVDRKRRQSFDKDDAQCVRIRSRAGVDGRCEESYYGKIYHGFQVWSDGERAKIEFRYFLNPNANDRNLEYDGRNLCLKKKDYYYEW